MLRAIFYARFHPERGPSIVHQYPASSIIPSEAEDDSSSLLNFPDISSYVIPPIEACNDLLCVLSTDGAYRVLGVPVSLESATYARNRFTFNVCFVLDADVDVRPWERIVRKTARFFRDIEEADGILQSEELLSGLRWAGDSAYPAAGVGVVYPSIRAVMEDLNTYGEASVSVGSDGVHVLNLRWNPPRCSTGPVQAWHVPLLIRPCPSTEDATCDPTLQRTCSLIDGVRHVQQIAERADVDVKLVQKALRELLRHQRILLLDIFHSQAIYSPTADFAWFVHDEKLLEECTTYISTNRPPPTHKTIINLYRQLGPGISVQDFCETFSHELTGIDIRRLITFGVLKGFLKRIHKYAISIESQPGTPKVSNGSAPTRTQQTTSSGERAWKTAALSSGWPDPKLIDSSPDTLVDQAEVNGNTDKLTGFLDGKTCMDEICLAMRIGEKKVVEMLRSGKYGEVMLICK